MGSFLKRSCTQFKGILYIVLLAKTSFSTQRFLPRSPENQAVAGREFSSLAFIFVFPGWIKGTWKDEVNPRGEEEVPGGHRTQGLNCLTDNFSLFSWKAKLYAKSEPPHFSSLKEGSLGKQVTVNAEMLTSVSATPQSPLWNNRSWPLAPRWEWLKIPTLLNLSRLVANHLWPLLMYIGKLFWTALKWCDKSEFAGFCPWGRGLLSACVRIAPFSDGFSVISTPWTLKVFLIG